VVGEAAERAMNATFATCWWGVWSLLAP
jgi:hypothetical protein